MENIIKGIMETSTYFTSKIQMGYYSKASANRF